MACPGCRRSREPALTQERLAEVDAPTLLMFGDGDLVTYEHINATYEGIPDSELAIVPGDLALSPAGEAWPLQSHHRRVLTDQVLTVAAMRRATAKERG
jgi:hypothetical protein